MSQSFEVDFEVEVWILFGVEFDEKKKISVQQERVV
jgi:hypothetical protein